MGRRFFHALALTALLVAGGARASAVRAQQQQDDISTANPPADVQRIVRAFTSKETEFRRALNEYSFQRDAVVQTIGMGGQITGEFHLTSRFSFSNSGERFEKIVFAPPSTLTEINMTREDIEDLGGVQPFALELSKIDQYNFNYVGRQHIDELDTYVFDVSPKSIPKKIAERFFQGRVWVDAQDLQIVKTRGKGVPEDKNNKYPTFDTYREQIDGKYWFPTYTFADDELVFGSGQVVHLKMRVRYAEFKRFRAKSVIIEEGEPGDVPPDKPEKRPPPPAFR
jgi:hypothetical protein